MRGRLITIEGLDGAGKTTLAEGLARARISSHGRWASSPVSVARAKASAPARSFGPSP